MGKSCCGTSLATSSIHKVPRINLRVGRSRDLGVAKVCEFAVSTIGSQMTSSCKCPIGQLTKRFVELTISAHAS